MTDLAKQPIDILNELLYEAPKHPQENFGLIRDALGDSQGKIDPKFFESLVRYPWGRLWRKFRICSDGDFGPSEKEYNEWKKTLEYFAGCFPQNAKTILNLAAENIRAAEIMSAHLPMFPNGYSYAFDAMDIALKAESGLATKLHDFIFERPKHLWATRMPFFERPFVMLFKTDKRYAGNLLSRLTKELGNHKKEKNWSDKRYTDHNVIHIMSLAAQADPTHEAVPKALSRLAQYGLTNSSEKASIKALYAIEEILHLRPDLATSTSLDLYSQGTSDHDETYRKPYNRLGLYLCGLRDGLKATQTQPVQPRKPSGQPPAGSPHRGPRKFSFLEQNH